MGPFYYLPGQAPTDVDSYPHFTPNLKVRVQLGVWGQGPQA